MEGYLVFGLLAVLVHASQSDQTSEGSHNTGNEQECTSWLISFDLLVGVGYGVFIVLAVAAAAVFLYLICTRRKRSKAEKAEQQKHEQSKNNLLSQG